MQCTDSFCRFICFKYVRGSPDQNWDMEFWEGSKTPLSAFSVCISSDRSKLPWRNLSSKPQNENPLWVLHFSGTLANIRCVVVLGKVGKGGLHEISSFPLFLELERWGSYEDSSAWTGRQGHVRPPGVLVTFFMVWNGFLFFCFCGFFQLESFNPRVWALLILFNIHG